MSPTSGTFTTYLGELRRNGLIEVQGKMAKASRELFPEQPLLPGAPTKRSLNDPGNSTNVYNSEIPALSDSADRGCRQGEETRMSFVRPGLFVALFASAVFGQSAFRPEIPRVWDDAALAEWATPVAGLNLRPKHMTAREY